MVGRRYDRLWEVKEMTEEIVQKGDPKRARSRPGAATAAAGRSASGGDGNGSSAEKDVEAEAEDAAAVVAAVAEDVAADEDGAAVVDDSSVADAANESAANAATDSAVGPDNDPSAETQTKKKKKRKNRKKKKKGGANASGVGAEAKDTEEVKARGFKIVPAKRLRSHGQTLPPTKTVASIYPKRDELPKGQILEHPLAIEMNTYRVTSAEMRARDRLMADRVADLREAAEIHRLVRADVQRFVRPGMRMADICERIEKTNATLIGLDPANPMARGWVFPTGVSVNNCAAHYTPNPGDETVFQYDDLMKVDFGVHINGHIIDCAWTMGFNPKYDALCDIVKESTNTGLRTAGIDVRLCDVGAAVQEVMESGEVELDGKVYQVKSITDLHGHSIEQWRVHGSKSVPNYDNGDDTRMEEGELFAIETFGSTGTGHVVEGPPACSHYMKSKYIDHATLRTKSAKQLLHYINRRFGTLAFCQRWLAEDNKRYLMGLKQLVDAGLVTPYPSLVDKPGSYTAQYEHTVLLRPTCKEVLSRGDDY